MNARIHNASIFMNKIQSFSAYLTGYYRCRGASSGQKVELQMFFFLIFQCIRRKVNHKKYFRKVIPLHRRASTQSLVHKTGHSNLPKKGSSLIFQSILLASMFYAELVSSERNMFLSRVVPRFDTWSCETNKLAAFCQQNCNMAAPTVRCMFVLCQVFHMTLRPR